MTSGLTKSCGCWHRDKLKELWKDEEFANRVNSKLPWVVGGKSLYSFREMCSLRQTGKKHTIEYRKMMSRRMTGSGASCWRGGVSTEHQRIRGSLETRLWREAVFKRDNYTCRTCGIRGVKIQSHHIKPFAKYPETRFDIDNGLTLCIPCHKKTDSFGKKFAYL